MDGTGIQYASAAGDPVIAAAGDIACDPSSPTFHEGNGSSTSCRQKYTSDLLVNAGLAGVLDLGDNQYNCGGYTAFLQSYDLSWGRVKSITHPVAGNHEYVTTGGTDCNITNEEAAGYFKYFGPAAGTAGQGWYSYDIGSWHIIALNSNCGDVGGCGSGSAQYQWLQNDLAAHNSYCTLAYWHIPLFSSGARPAPNSKPFWTLLYSHDADLILDGHDHLYERFAPQTPSGTLDTARGIREFTVGTGGANHNAATTVAANSEVRNTDTFGILKLTLHSTGYSWKFVPESGKTFTDSGTTNCHGNNPPTPTPTPTSTSKTFLPQADAYVNSGSPASNYGASTTLRADASPDLRSYARFSVSGLNGAAITRARLQFYMNNSSASGLQALSVADNTWGETTVTYNNAPALGSAVATSGALTGGTWVTMDVSSYVKAQGTYSFGITTPGSAGLSLGSRESGATAPRLILTLSTGPTASPTPTKTRTPLPTATGQAAPTTTPTPTPISTRITFVPQADAYVSSSSPASNYGSSTTLRADGSPDLHSYLRFSVSGLNGAAITRVRLRMYVNAGSTFGFNALAVPDNAWGESSITYSNAPALGSTLASSGGVTSGTWVMLDVSPYVTAEGTYSIGITTPGSTALSLASRETGANAPQLLVDLAP